MEDISFDNYWTLFNPEAKFANRRSVTRARWEQCPTDRRRAIIRWLEAGKPKCTNNPYFFIQDFSEPRQQTLTYQQYYAKYGTTEEVDGWKMENPTGRKVIYVK